MSPAALRHRQIVKEQTRWRELERAVLGREADLRHVSECMGGTSIFRTHIQRNHWDHWELRYLNAQSGRTGMPDSAYKARNAARHCASDWRTCKLECAGCDGNREA